eukprot:TRINITY_DN51370_c0_g1_i1.p1 TRINITY_DN51370_c0_g1~~TRINITY_DN51370_c0_g1_i1.p1  ORF type:complete len:482 (+),score=87.27 TRINITY_DN51370_c0_g1_i1:130-1575(+)
MLSQLPMSRQRRLIASPLARLYKQQQSALPAAVQAYPLSFKQLRQLQPLLQQRCFADRSHSDSKSGESTGNSDSKSSESTEGSDSKGGSGMKWGLRLAAFGAVNVVLQKMLGTGSNTFEKRFIVYNKDPYDLEEFYQAEELLHVMGFHPFFFELIMGRVMWWDPTEITRATSILPGTEDGHLTVRNIGMEIAFELSEKEVEDELGETTLGSFQRLERFINFIPFLADLGCRIVLCDHTWTFGFDRKKDGSIACYHKCIHFWGLWPMRLGMWAHMTYTTWACESFLNGPDFGNEDRVDEANAELAFLLPHIYMDLIDKLLHRQRKILEQKKAKKPEVQHSEEKAEIEEHEKQIQKLEALKKQGPLNIPAVVRQTPSSTQSPLPSAGDVVQRSAIVHKDGKTVVGDGVVGKKPLGTPDAPSSGREPSVKLLTSDKETRDVLQKALLDAKHDVEVHAAMKEMSNHPEMQWQKQPKRKDTQSKSA